MDTKKKEKDVIVYEKDLDMSSASRGVWLVKVPKYISNKWDKCPGNIEAGRLNITKIPHQKPQIKLILSEAILCLQDEKEKQQEDIPKEHILNVSAIKEQTLGVFSQFTSPASSDSLIETEKLGLEGRVVQRLECRPQASTKYMKLKLDSLIKASQPARTVITLNHVVNSYKPVADHKHNIEFEEKKKSEGKKSRDDKEKVNDMLFAAFEKHQYYNIKDLVKLTKQPVVRLLFLAYIYKLF